MAKCVDCEKLKLHKYVPVYVTTEDEDELETAWLPSMRTTREESLRNLPFCLGLKKPLGRRWNINKERKCKHYRPKRLIAEDMLRTGL